MVVEDLDYRNNHDYDPQYYPKETFSIPCNVDNDIYGKPGNRLNLTFQQFSDWPRCIPGSVSTSSRTTTRLRAHATASLMSAQNGYFTRYANQATDWYIL